MAVFVQPASQNDAGDFDEWLTKQLKVWQDGFGSGVLLLSLPQRFRRLPRPEDEGQAESADGQELYLSKLKATKFRNHAHFYIPGQRRKSRIQDLPRESPSGSKQNADYGALLASFAQQMTANYFMDVNGSPQVRRHLNIDTLPFSEWRCGSLSQLSNASAGIHTPYLYVAGDGAPAPFALHVEDSYLYSLNYLHVGAHKFWVVVHPHDRERLEKRLRACAAPSATHSCSQFVRHMSAWVPLEVLDGWEIRYTRLEQRPGNLVVTAPGVYHQGWNGGWNVAEAINYGDDRSVVRARDYRYCTRQCSGEEPLVLEWPATHREAQLPPPDFIEITPWIVPSGAKLKEFGLDTKSVSVEEQLRAANKLNKLETKEVASSLQHMVDSFCAKASFNNSAQKPLKDAATLFGKQLQLQLNKRTAPSPSHLAAAQGSRKRLKPSGRAGTTRVPPSAAQSAPQKTGPLQKSPTGVGSGPTGEIRIAKTTTPGAAVRKSSRLNPPPSAAAAAAARSVEAPHAARCEAEGGEVAEEDESDEDQESEAGEREGGAGTVVAAAETSAAVASASTATDAGTGAEESSNPAPASSGTENVSQPAATEPDRPSVPAAERTEDVNPDTHSLGGGSGLPVDRPDQSSGTSGLVTTAEVAAGDVRAAAEPSPSTCTSTVTIVTEPTSTAAPQAASDTTGDDDESGTDPHPFQQCYDISTSKDGAYAAICTQAMHSLDGWRDAGDDNHNAGSSSSSSAPRPSPSGTGASILDMLSGRHNDAVRDSSGQLWDARRMQRHVDGANTNAAKARFMRNVALMRLAAWVAQRLDAPVADGVAGRQKVSAVLDMLVAHAPNRTRRSWWLDWTAGKYWITLVDRFGGGVALIMPHDMGFHRQGLGYESQKRFAEVLAAREAEDAFRDITSKITTRLKSFYTAVDETESMTALNYLREASMGEKPWNRETSASASAAM